MHLLSHRSFSTFLFASMSSASLVPPSSSSTTWLRVLQINDVYELDNFPNLKTAIAELSQSGPDKTLVILAGDFLAPSLLSSLDNGSSMVDCLNALGVTHVSIGNHEADVPYEALLQRIQASQFQWLNTNMPEFSSNVVATTTTTKSVITVGNNKRRVALLGLLTDDPSLYRPGSFGGATIEPVIAATKRILAEDDELRQVDLIIPMTHQSIEDDESFARAFKGRFPVICGGHEHDIYEEVVEKSVILKTGMDAENIGVIDIQWKDDDTKPSINIDIRRTSSFDPDMDMMERVTSHKHVLVELDRARLFRVSDWSHDGSDFSTQSNRILPVSTGTSALATMLRMGLRCQCALLNAGSVRANKTYDHDEYFTWSDLKGELPFATAMIGVLLPGSVLEATISYARRTKHGSGGYLHFCNNISYDTETNSIKSIQGYDFDSNKSYLTALPAQFFAGIDNHQPILDWASSPAGQSKFSIETAIPAKLVLVQVFSALLWLQMGSFGDIDRDNDGVISREELSQRVAEMFGGPAVDLVVDNIFSVADMTGDGTITPLEVMITQFVATDMLDHVCSSKELQVMHDVASSVLGKSPTQEEVKGMVAKILDTLDVSGDGTIHRSEVMQSLGLVTRTDLL